MSECKATFQQTNNMLLLHGHIKTNQHIGSEDLIKYDWIQMLTNEYCRFEALRELF